MWNSLYHIYRLICCPFLNPCLAVSLMLLFSMIQLILSFPVCVLTVLVFLITLSLMSHSISSLFISCVKCSWFFFIPAWMLLLDSILVVWRAFYDYSNQITIAWFIVRILHSFKSKIETVTSWYSVFVNYICQMAGCKRSLGLWGSPSWGKCIESELNQMQH